MNLSVSVLRLQRPIVAYALAPRTHTYSFSSSPFLPPSHTDRPLCAGTDEICMRVRLDYTCRLWEPGPLWSLFTVRARKTGKLPFQSTTSNKSPGLIGSGTHEPEVKFRDFLFFFFRESGRKSFGVSSQLPAGICLKINRIEFCIHRRSDS